MRKRTIIVILSLSTTAAILIPFLWRTCRDEGEMHNGRAVVIPYRIDGRARSDSQAGKENIWVLKLISHRGFSSEAPENTLPAYRLSKGKGYGYVETDVQFTKDQVAVCLHDKEINRTARLMDGRALNRRVRISDITYEQARTYDYGSWKSEKYKGTPILTFEQFIRTCDGLALHPYVELKAPAFDSDEKFRRVADIIAANDMNEKVTFISFKYEYLEKMRALCPSARLGFLYDRRSRLDMKRLLKLKNPENEVFVDAEVSAFRRILRTCRENDVPLEVWTVDDVHDLDNMDRYISGVTTNCITYPAD